MKKVSFLFSLLSSVCGFSSYADQMQIETPTINNAISELSHRIIVDKTASEDLRAKVHNKDAITQVWGPDETITYSSKISVTPNIAPDISLNKFKEFGMDGDFIYKKHGSVGSLDIKNNHDAKLIIFEVTGNKGSAINGVDISINNKADLAIINQNGFSFWGNNLSNILNFNLINDDGTNFIDDAIAASMPELYYSATADLSPRIILDDAASKDQTPQMTQKDTSSILWGSDVVVTSKADILLHPNINSNVSLNKFKEFGMEGWTSYKYAPFTKPGKLNIHNPLGAQLVIFEITGDKSSYIGNTNITMKGNKADFILANKNGSVLFNNKLRNFSSFTASELNSDAILAPRNSTPAIMPEAFILVNSVSHLISLDANGNLKSYLE